MKPFISGGAGFIGSHLVRRLLSRADVDSIVVFDNFSSGQESYLADLSSESRLKIVRADLKDLDAVESAMQGCDTVFHLAANPDIAKAVTQPDIDFWEGTYLGHNVIEAMRRTGAKLLYYTSGSGVYGENPGVDFSENYGPLIPISTYAASKIACESLFSAYCHMFGLTARVFRFANVVGPRQTHGVGYDFVRRLRQDPTRLRILGDGTQCKSYIHVEDILNAIFTVPIEPSTPYSVCNVASGDYITVTQIAEAAVKVCGLEPESVRFEFTGGDRGWKGDVPVVRFDCSKIHSLGWTCQRSSLEAVQHAMAAMLQEISHA